MDPLTITTAVLKITATCLSAAQSLNELRNKYNDAPLTIVTICSEATLISASLSQIQNLVLRRHDLTNVLQARPDLAAALDTSLIGCAVLFSCLHEEMQCITKGSMLPDKFTWKGKARAIWNHDRLRELLDGLRGQQTAINTIINLLQVNSLKEIKELLQRHNDVFATTAERTRSLRESTPTMDVPDSIYGGGGRERSIYPSAISVAGSSGIEFDFDDQIVNSKVYKRILAQAMTKTMASDVEAIEDNVLDFSNVATIKETAIQKEEASATARLLEGLVISQEPEKVLSKKHIDTLDGKFWLAKTLHNQQKYAEAEELFRESVLGREKVLGKKHTDTLTSKVWLATTLYNLQKYIEAEEFFRESAQGREKMLGKDNADTIYSINYLATTLYNLQKYTEAEEFFRESAQGREKTLGKEHAHTLSTKVWLAMTLYNLQKYIEAEEFFRESAQGREKTLGKDNADTIYCIYWLAMTLYNQQKYIEAEEFFRESAQGREKILGKEHAHTLSTKVWLAMTLYNQQKYTEAEELLRESAQGREKTLGKDNADTIYCIYWLAMTLYNQQKYIEAEEFFRDSAQGREKILGKEHADTLNSKVWLAKALYNLEKYTEAEELFRESV